jgi:transcriptional regulator with XRE-family HTH domain
MILAGKMLKEARLDAGLTQAELAERLGASQPVVARLESGRANPRIATFERALAATGHRLAVTVEQSGHPSIDETLIASSLRLSPEERIRRFSSAYEGARAIAGAALNGNGSQGRTTSRLA